MIAKNGALRSSGSYERLNEEWKKTSKILFGREAGDLREYEEWLLRSKQPMLSLKSGVSGKEVVFPSDDYPENAKAASYEEASAGAGFQPLDVNQIKDIDSLMDAFREQIRYSGNIVLGNSSFVEKSSSVSDSFYVYSSARVHNSKYVACSTIAKSCGNIFGCNVTSFSNYAVRCHQQGKGARNFEVNLAWLSSDCYYSYNVMGCTDCIFSFNLRNKRHAIGNLALAREKYLSVKSRLMEQIADELERKKRAPSLVEIINGCGPVSQEERVSLSGFAKTAEEKGDMKPVEQAFATASRLVFGKPLSGLESYGPWLKERVIDVDECESALGSGKIAVPAYANFKALKKERFVSLPEAGLLGENLKLAEQEVERLDLSAASGILAKIAFLSAGDHEGPMVNVMRAPIVINSSNCYSVLGCVNLKNSAYSTWPNGSDHVFGCAFLMDSAFSIKCYQSFGLNSCFEVDSSSVSSRSYFSHNVENVHEAMFCFNVKNMNYAIWNQAVGRENYLKVKGMLQSWLLEKLEKVKTLGLDIFSLAQSGRT